MILHGHGVRGNTINSTLLIAPISLTFTIIISTIHKKTAKLFGALKINVADVFLLIKSAKVNISLNKGGPDGPVGMNIALVRFKPLKVV